MLVLSRADVERSLEIDTLIDALADAFVALSAGETSVPPRIAAFGPDGFLGAMPGYVPGVLEAKLVTVFPGNHSDGLPSHQALIFMFDPDTGTPLALMDGTAITATRTACSSAVATRSLAREDVGTLAVLGAGVQGRAHLEAIPRVRNFEEVRVASRTASHARQLAEEFDAVAVEDFQAAVRGADVVCVCTDSSAPVIDGEWLSPGTHVTSVGASPKGPELDDATIRAGLLVVESRVAFQPPPAGSPELQGLEPDSAVEIGEILSGARAGRTSEEQITVYKSMGHAVEDAAAARLVYESALTRGLGTDVSL